MTSSRLTRRGFLGVTAALACAACARETAPPSPPSATRRPDERHRRLTDLERSFGARLGVYALAIGTGAEIAHRADERFAFCSTFKGLAAAAILHRNPMSHLDTLVRYTEDDLLKNAVITSDHVATGMTLRQLCDAALRHSDGTAGNLLLRDVGGPAELTRYLRGLGDKVTRMDRWEPEITEATPGDPRDTSSPRALGSTYREIVLGDALPPNKRAFLRDLLERDATSASAQRVRAGVPRGWTVADKTGTGDYGTLNDIALVWPPKAAPLLVSIMSSMPDRDAEYDQALLAEAARYVTTTLTS